ncbi:MAG: EAL domain-containing protein [Desulfovibrio sp.]|nr:EAL domain-containing protein [Desulfovibrio sp.]
MGRRILYVLACLGIVTIFAALTHSISETVILSGVNAIERRQTVSDMHQLRSYLLLAEQRMHQHLVDWAVWDEAYEYIVDQKSEFILNNFDQSLLDDLHLSSAAFYDLSGKLISFVGTMEIARGIAWARAERKIFKNLTDIVLSQGLDSQEGFVMLRGEGMVLAAHKVYDGNKLKPPRGVLVMSRLMDQNFMAEAEAVTNLRFSIHPVATFTAIRTPTVPGAYFKVVQSKDFIHAYSVVFDVFGKAAFALNLRRERDIAAVGRQLSARNFWLILGLGCFVLIFGLSLLMHMQRRWMQRELEYRENHDSLTGLPNKIFFTRKLGEILAEARHRQNYVGVLFLDLDRFKVVNDSYGHAQGDIVLREAAQRLDKVLCQGLAARSGGDDFLIAVAATKRDAVLQEAQALLAVMDAVFPVEDKELHLGASIGMAFFPEHGLDSESLVQRAELAMYHAKEVGGNNVRVFTQNMGDRAAAKMGLETALYAAVAHDALKVHYQPKVNIATRDVSGCEALVRWQNDEGRMIPPPVFIPLAEENGLITRIDMFVLRSVCRQIQAWKSSGGRAVPVAVNMSARSILSGDFATNVIRVLEEERTPPDLIELEITETCLMTHMDTAFAAITRLHDAGLRIALDDFGTGYSSMQYLQAMPIACLKIDKQFIDGIFRADGDTRALVRGILALAANLGMDTVAEGVEDLDQLSFLAANHCNVIQGYLFSRPLNGTDCASFLRDCRIRINAVAGGVVTS